MEVDPAPPAVATPMEVDENVAPAAIVAAPNPLSGEHVWELPNFSSLSGKHLSEPFEIGGYSWQLMVYPQGNNRSDAMALYLAVAEEEQAAFGLQRSATFKLALLSSVEGGDLAKEASHIFTGRETDWGFTTFINFPDLRDPARGFLADDTLRVKVNVEVKPPEDVGYDSRKETGFVGLKNQGATCYMNSLLQTLFNINAFRRAVYHMPTSEDSDPASSMPLALQSVFYKLQFTAGPVSTKDLTSSFGWDTADAFQQHDVQELELILYDALENKMKDTRVEGMINKLFQGHKDNYVECIDVDFKSTNKEPFIDVQLLVQGCKDIYASFDKYCEVETLDGDNKYQAEGHGLQDAKKGTLFDEFPPVLQLHLMRFSYDYMKDMMTKINDRYEFYDVIDLGRDGGKYLSGSADRSKCNRYKLLAVMVHSGGVHGGHYYAYIRPDGKQWLKFDDERVEKADDQKAVEANWGGDGDDRPAAGGFGNFRLARNANAYMLVYVRESEWDSVMCRVDKQDISAHVRARLQTEQEDKEKRKKEKAEAHLYSLVRVATDADLVTQIGTSRHFDLVDHEQVKTFKMSKKAPFSELQRLVAEEMGVPVEQQRFWKWSQRQNGTYRPASVLKPEGPDTPISSIKETAVNRNMRPGVMATLNLFLETPDAATGQLPPLRPNLDLMLFFKQYCPTGEHPNLKYAGRAIVAKDTKVKELFEDLRKRGGLESKAALEVYEEIKFEPNVMVEKMTATQSLAAQQLEDGDILVFQQQLKGSEAAAAGVQHATAKEFMEWVRNRQLVTFRPLEDGQGDEGVLELELLKSDTYDNVSTALAAKLGLDHPLKLRLTAQNPLTQMPRPHAIRHRQFDCLQDMLKAGPAAQSSTLYYEVIDLPLPEFENLLSFKIAYHNSKLEEVSQHSLRIQRAATVGDMLEELRRLLPEDAEAKEKPLRLLEVYQWKIWQLFDPRLRVESIGDNTWHLRVEAVPEDQADLDQPGVQHVHCLQVTEDGSNSNQRPFAFSDPFIMRLAPEETVGQLRDRVQRMLGIPDEEFEGSWKPVLCTFGGVEPLGDDVVVASRLDANPRLYGHQERNCIGFVHDNKNPRRTHAHLNSRLAAWQGQEKQLRIRG
ncbi:ubiquitin carboxyl-terminal hydrolase 12 [Micractinium conductrix]|uniref:ubiquitinyl hydrolase 1 n=1 Tax=Micractinium conductrix TaxID=554055 RepID=A0A2P6VGK9_9CHLO|nr:ubiquitin carboxyl-terminal hydrolase 12 [Micractinium conductrix]|eukprot:PSC73213.1 ubiquitin carboxyl-terminal hydrolase 12 [Micractinium conductrix]